MKVFNFIVVAIVAGFTAVHAQPNNERIQRARENCFNARTRRACGPECGWNTLTSECAPADLNRHCAQYRTEAGCTSRHPVRNNCVWRVTEDIGYCVNINDPSIGILPETKPEMTIAQARAAIRAKPNCFENTSQSTCSVQRNNHCGWSDEFNLCGPLSSFRMCFQHQRQRCQRDSTCHFDTVTGRCFDIRDRRLQ